MEVRRRKPSGSGAAENDKSRSNSPESKAAKVDRTFTRIIGLAFVLAGAALTFNLDRLLALFHQDHYEHAVVIDAGSTGSRVLAFTFKEDKQNRMVLVDELWKQVKPGLSSFALEPFKAGESVLELVDAAKQRIPEKYWSFTPITLKATAGLRLLPKDQSEAIINEVTAVLQKSGFKPDPNHLIEVMNPMEEGLFAWFTVNYLLGAFEPSKQVWTSAVTLDLGGGSTQITFAPKKLPVEGLVGRKHFTHNVDIIRGQPLKVYSHSYLGLGLMAAREAVFTKEGGSESACLTSKAPLEFAFHGNSFSVSRSPSKSGFNSCLSMVNSVISDNEVHQPQEILSRDIAAFSYFYDLAIDAGLISGLEGTTKVGDYAEAARKACLDPNSKFECLDFTFVYGLLKNGYGLPDSKVLRLFKKINGHEASWALGVAYNIIHS